MNPKFTSYSVVLTTHNSSSYICKALDSVFAQSFQPSQVIVVDDCSSDKTIELISSYPIKVMQTPVNSGTSIARNLGLSAVQTEIIFSLDADDIWDTHLARDHMEIWNNCDPNLAALGTLMRLEFEDKAKPRVKTPVGSISAELLKGVGLYDLASHNPFFASATSFRTFKLKDLGGWSDRPFTYCEDYALLAKFLIFGDKIGILPTVNGI
jgi:glycosyltransferase involved in cell wall biosynthesis